MLYLLAIFISICAIVFWFLSGRSVLSPAVLFSVGFAACSLGAALRQEAWGYPITERVLIAVAGGVLVFGLFCAIIHSVFTIRSEEAVPARLKTLPIDVTALSLFAFFQLVTVAWSLIQIVDMFPDQSIQEAIGSYNLSAKFGSTQYGELPGIRKDVSWHFPLGPLRTIEDALAFIAFFMFAQELVLKRRRYLVLLLVNCLLALGSTLVTGSRGVAIGYVIFAVASYMIIKCKDTRSSTTISVGNLFFALTCCFVVLVSFRVLAVGREGSFDFLEYIGIYIGAQIPNLDLFLSDNLLPSSAFFGEQTLKTSLDYLGKTFDIEALQDIPYTWTFNSYNGYQLGNVYTTFYPFLQDGGCIGLIFFTALMACVAQAVFELSLRIKGANGSLLVIAYGMMVAPILLSFFAHRFFTDVLSVFYVRKIVIIAIGLFIYRRWATRNGAE